MSRRLVTVASALTLTTFALAASAAAVEHLKNKSTDEATVTVKGPFGLKVKGRTDDISVTDSGDSITVTVGIGGLDTADEERNKDLQKHLSNKKVAKAVTLKVAKSALKFPAEGKKVQNEKATGTFTLNGVPKSYPFKYSVSRTGSDYHVSGSADGIDMSAHGINKICKVGDSAICVKDDIDVTAAFKLREK